VILLTETIICMKNDKLLMGTGGE